MKKVAYTYTIVRILLGLAFLFFGASKFFPTESPALPAPAMDFLAAMGATGYFIPLVGVVEILIGILLLANLWVPFSMMMLSAVMINVILFNLFLAPSAVGAIMLLVLVGMQAYIMYCTWPHYRPLFVRSK